MEITEVRIKLMEEPGERLQAFCSITFDDSFVVRDLKIIEGSTGPFVAMPSRKLTAHCPQCGCKNHLRAAYCNQCGSKLREQTMAKDDEGRAKLYADIAHPINSVCREMIQTRVIHAYEEEKARAKMPGYVPAELRRIRRRPGSPRGAARSAPCERGSDANPACRTSRAARTGPPSARPTSRTRRTARKEASSARGSSSRNASL